MTNRELQEQIERASEIVASWPVWKQNILIHSSQPRNSVPREPVIYSSSAANQNTSNVKNSDEPK
ncbi:MAG: hypothetical protein KF851_09755 [Pirellulaceae bacterium]|nr:hypothetical protein [Pirellulaceae bacterium]